MSSGNGLRPGRTRFWMDRIGFMSVLLGCLLTGPAFAEQAGPTSDSAEVSPTVVPSAVRGRVQDPDGAWVTGASVRLDTGDARVSRTVETDAQGRFVFRDVSAGAYSLTVTEPGMEAWSSSGQIGAGAEVDLAGVKLVMVSATADVQVTATETEVAAAQVELEEQQRVLGFIPNFYATYMWDAEPLRARQKFDLAWKSVTDPVSFAMTGVVAGVEQAQGSFPGYGQGARGYSRRYGASFADGLTSVMVGQAVLPTVFRQDPRYFVKGTGSILARGLYAISTTVVCRGDNRRWEPNYSNVLGNVISAGISNAYYPASDRHGAGLTLENSMVQTALGSVGALFQEFVVRRLTPHVPTYDAR